LSRQSEILFAPFVPGGFRGFGNDAFARRFVRRRIGNENGYRQCFPFGKVMIPMSLVAAVMPSRVPEVPVLCATIASLGRSPFKRRGPVIVLVEILSASA
jgi:hypothetical protein